jgi:hypothetical protein
VAIEEGASFKATVRSAYSLHAILYTVKVLKIGSFFKNIKIVNKRTASTPPNLAVSSWAAFAAFNLYWSNASPNIFGDPDTNIDH